MKKLILLISFLLSLSIGNTQNNSEKGSGILWTSGVPTITVDTDYDSEWAVDTTNNKTIYLYDRDAAAWIKAGYFIQQTLVVGVPTHTPHDAQSVIAINEGDSLFYYRAGSWRLVSGGGSGADTQDLSITAGKGTINLVDGGSVTLGDSSSTNEGIVTFTIAANEGTLNSNTFSNNPEIFAGRGILVLSDSAGYNLLTATEVDGSVSNEGVVTVNRESDSTVYRITTNSSGSETLWLKEGNNISFSSPSSGTGTDTLIISSTGGSPADADYGDITISGGVWNIDAGVVGATEIADSAITTVKIISNAVTATGLATGSVTSLKILDNTITGSDLSTTLTTTGNTIFGNSTNTLTLSSTSTSSSVAVFLSASGNNTSASGTIGGTTFTTTSGTKYDWRMLSSYNVSSGTGLFYNLLIAPAIGQSGGASGITGGVIVSPSFNNTVADFRCYTAEVGFQSGGDDVWYGFYQKDATGINYYEGESRFEKHTRHKEISAPATPPAGYGYLYAFTDDSLYYINNAGTSINLCRSSGSGGSYTNEDAQDAIGNMLNASLSYDDATPRLYITPRDYGDITATDSGRTWTIDAAQVTYAKIQDVATDKLLGRDAAGTGSVTAIGVSGGIEFTGSDGIQTSAFTGDVTKTAGGTVLTIANDAVTYAKMQNVSAASKLLGRGSAGGSGDVEEITLGTNLSMSGTTLNASGGSDGNGIYTGSGTVASNVVADMGYISANETFVIGHGLPTEDYDATEYGLKIESTSSGTAFTSLWGADSINQTRTLIAAGDNSAYLLTANNATSQSSQLNVDPDSITVLSDQFRINVDTLSIKIGGSHGNVGDVLTRSGGHLAVWAAPSGGADSYTTVTSGNIPDNTIAQVLRTRKFGLGYFPEFNDTSYNKDKGLIFHADGMFLTHGDSVSNSAHLLNLGDDHARLYSRSGNSNIDDIYLDAAGGSSITTTNGTNNSAFDFTPSLLHFYSTVGGNTSRIKLNGDSIFNESLRYRVDADSFHLKIAGSNGTTGYVLKSNGPGWGATWQPDNSAGLGATDTAYFHHQRGNSYGVAWIGGSNDNFATQLEVQDSIQLSLNTDWTSMFNVMTSTTNALVDGLYIGANSYNTAAAGFGTSLMFKLESSTTNDQGAATIGAYWTTATHASREAALTFQLGDNGGSLAEVMKLDRTTSTGLLSIGSTTPVTLGIGGLTTAASFIIGNSANLLTIGNSSGQVRIVSSTGAAGAIELHVTGTGSTIEIGNTSSTGPSGFETSGSNKTSNTVVFKGIAQTNTYAPTGSGAGSWSAFIDNSVINQTGGAVGITRGLYVNPTLTAIADYRGIDLPYSNSSAKGIYQTGANTTNIFVGNTGFGTTAAPTSDVTVNGTLGLSYVEKTGTYTAGEDYTINCTANTFTVDLPTAVGITGRTYVIKNSGAGTITIDGNGSETIDGATTVTLSVQYSGKIIQSDGANWIVIGSF